MAGPLQAGWAWLLAETGGGWLRRQGIGSARDSQCSQHLGGIEENAVDRDVLALLTAKKAQGWLAVYVSRLPIGKAGQGREMALLLLNPRKGVAESMKKRVRTTRALKVSDNQGWLMVGPAWHLATATGGGRRK
ncbi:hypothetical protein C8R44DRAFT_845923 [Mycena epipterygia]|nr:hypothetical protein C8R44DRAFT_845923 [Mycena epipterygia]